MSEKNDFDHTRRGDTVIYQGQAYAVQKVKVTGIEVAHPGGGTFIIRRWERFTKENFRG